MAFKPFYILLHFTAGPLHVCEAITSNREDTMGTTKPEQQHHGHYSVALLIAPQQGPPKADESQLKWAMPAFQTILIFVGGCCY